MPTSLQNEEAILKWVAQKGELAATKSYLGLATSATVEKKTTGKVFGEAEPKEADGWVRKQADELEWEVEKAEGASGATKLKNKNAIVWEPPVTKGEYKLETAALLTKAKQTEDLAETKEVLISGKLTTPVTINAATTKLEFKPKELVLETE